MKPSYQVILYVILASITIYGIVSGKFLFLIFMLPLGFSFFKKKND
ncbi:hypothetical protein [Psychroserpens mesophilus]|nr:hypothetical protein [Psychroserpens mesophilus]